MTSPIGIVHGFLAARSPRSLPSGNSFLLTGLKIVHWGWWLSVKKETYSNQPRNWVYLIGGCVLDRMIGDRGPLRLAVQIYILALRMHRVLEELDLLSKEITDLTNALKGHYVPYPALEWSKTYAPGLFKKQPHTPHSDYLKLRMRRIVSCTQNVFKRLFSLSNRCFHAYEGFYASTHPEIFVETLESLEGIEENKARILKQLENQKTTITYFLNALQLPFTFDQVVAGMKTGLEGASLTYHVMDKAGIYGGNALLSLMKISVTTLATFFNLDHQLPLHLHANPEKRLYLQLKK